LHPTDCFITSTLQKHIFREVKLTDAAVNNKDALRWNPLGKRWVMDTGGANKGGDGDDGPDDEDDGDDDERILENTKQKEKQGDNIPALPTKNNPFTVAVYGQICIAAKSYQSALCSYLHTMS
jgi:general transcription factor 3C polypeptide 3 (transcription factor C subunit 4)